MRPEMAGFIWGGIHRRVQDGFSILVLSEDTTQVFGEMLKISRTTVVPHAHCRPRLILNLSAQLKKVTSSVNNTTDRDIAPDSMQFGRAFTRIFQAIWEAYPTKGPVRASKLDVPDAYHCGTLWPSQVGAFT